MHQMCRHRTAAACPAKSRMTGDRADDRGELVLGDRHCHRRQGTFLLCSDQAHRAVAQLVVDVHKKILPTY